MTPEDLEAAEMVFSAEGRQIAEGRYGPALQRATELGQAGRVAAIQSKIERDMNTHARRNLMALTRSGRSSAPPAPMPSVGELFQGIQHMGPPAPAPSMLERPNALMADSIDYGAPMAGTRRLSEATIPNAGWYLRGRPSENLVARPLMPQSYVEDVDQQTENRNLNMLFEGTGLNPAYRSGQAFAEGDYLAGVGNAGIAAMPYKPAAGLALAGGAYASALGQTLAPTLFGTSSADAQAPEIPSQFIPKDRGTFSQENRRWRPLADLQTEAERAVLASDAYRSVANDDPRTARRMINEARNRAEQTFKAQGTQEADEARIDAAYQAYLQSLSKQRDDFMQSRSSAAENERAVTEAERVRRQWEDRDVQWKDTPVGRLNERMGGYGPMVLGGVAGALTRGTGRIMGHGDDWRFHYLAPSVTGGFLGGTSINAPQIYNATAPDVMNPRRRALEEYAAALPPNHPRRAETLKRLEDTVTLPVLNPVVQNANEQLGLAPTVRRTLSGIFLEGAPGGVMGSEMARGGEGLVRRLGSRRTEGTTGSILEGAGGPPPPPSTPGGGGSFSQPNALATLGNQAERRPLNPPEVPPPAPASAVPPPTVQELLRRRRQKGPIEGGHWVDPSAPPTIGEAWVSPKGNKMWTRDREGNFRDEVGELVRDSNGGVVTDPRTARPTIGPNAWRRISSIDDIRPSAGAPTGRNALLG